MAEKKRENINESAGRNPAFVIKKEKLGVFVKPWQIVKRYGQNSLNVHITSFRALQLIFNQDEIESLLQQGAPLRVYYRDVEPPTGGSN